MLNTNGWLWQVEEFIELDSDGELDYLSQTLSQPEVSIKEDPDDEEVSNNEDVDGEFNDKNPADCKLYFAAFLFFYKSSISISATVVLK